MSPSGRFVVIFLILMPLPTLNTRAFGQASPAQKEISRLAEMRGVHAVFNSLRTQEPELRKTQMEMTTIAAPPFAERARAEWLKERFIESGLQEVEIDNIGNVTGLRPGSDAAAKLVAVTAHIDTVFPAGTPIHVRQEDDRMYGPGIGDNGAGVTALLALARALKDVPLKIGAGILFVGNVGEEGEGDLRGARYLFEESKWKDRIGETIVVDGSGADNVVTKALGSRRFEVTVRGPGGHSWGDFGTPNPIVALSKAVVEFSAATVPQEPKTTFNVGTISGGTSVNSIPESAWAKVDIRSSDPAEIDKLEQRLRESVRRAVESSQPTGRKAVLTAEIKKIGERPAAELPQNARILDVIRAVDAHLGLPGQLRRASTDANIPLSMGREAIAVGGGGDGGAAHTVHEWYNPAGRDLALKRIALAVLALAGVSE